MGIDYSGGMIVGEIGSKLSEPDEYEDGFNEWAEENELESMSQYYDCDQEDKYYGFRVDNVEVEKIDGEWLDDVKQKAEKFEKLTGVKAKLIGTQDIW